MSQTTQRGAMMFEYRMGRVSKALAQSIDLSVRFDVIDINDYKNLVEIQSIYAFKKSTNFRMVYKIIKNQYF